MAPAAASAARATPASGLVQGALTWRETLPGALFAAVFLQGSFQLLPLFVRLSGELIALQAYGGLVLLLVWLYLMANILVLGAEVNWWLGRSRARVEDEQAPGVA